jgi:hypothetical protein
MIDEKRLNELAKYLYELGDYYNEQCLEAAEIVNTAETVEEMDRRMMEL